MGTREIKFRAWDKGVKEMVQTPFFPNDVHQVTQDPESYEIMQFTGLTDKNGKEIYEGDVVSCVGGYEVGEDDSPAVVAWNEKLLRWDAEGLCALYEFDLSEVIGNIYENPELL